MRRPTLLLGIGLAVLLALAGCSSKEDKKQSHLTQGKEYFDKGEFKSAKIELKNAIQIDPKFAQAYMLLAETSLKLGEAQEAFRAYSAVAELDPANTEAQLKLATFLLLAQKYDEARTAGGRDPGARAEQRRGAAAPGHTVRPRQGPLRGRQRLPQGDRHQRQGSPGLPRPGAGAGPAGPAGRGRAGAPADAGHRPDVRQEPSWRSSAST